MSDWPDYSDLSVPSPTVQLDPSFGQPWYSSGQAAVGSGATQSWVVTIADTDFIYYVDTITLYCTAAHNLFYEIDLVADVVTMGSATGVFVYPFNQNPSAFLISGDTVTIKITDLEVSGYTYGYKLVGTKFPRPIGFSKPPGCSFSITPVNGIAPLTLTCVDASTYVPTSWEWKLDNLTIDSTVKNPVIVTNKIGRLSTSLRVTNANGYDILTKFFYLAIGLKVPWSDMIEVDPNNIISTDGFQTVLNGASSNVNAYLYKDYGAGYFNYCYSYAHVYCVSSASNGQAYILDFSNVISDGWADTGHHLGVLIGYRAGGIILNVCHGTGLHARTDGTTVNLSCGVDYWLRFWQYLPGSAYCDIYSDSSYSTLVGTSILVDASLIGLTFRYMYGFRTNNYANAGLLQFNSKYPAIVQALY